MKKFLLLIATLLSVGVTCIAGCADDTSKGNAGVRETPAEYSVQDETPEENPEDVTDDSQDKIPEEPRLCPHKQRRRRFPVPFPEHPAQPK